MLPGVHWFILNGLFDFQKSVCEVPCTFVEDLLCRYISTLVEFSVSFMLPQKHSAAGRSRLPEIPSLFFLPALEGGELAIPKQLISASYPTHATAPVTVLTDRRLRSVGK